MMWVSEMYSASVLERVMMGCFLGTKHLKLVLEGNTTVTGFSDADWASQLHCHSISGFTYFVSLRTISWSAKK